MSLLVIGITACIAFKLLIIFLFESSTIFDCDVVPDVKSNTLVSSADISILLIESITFLNVLVSLIFAITSCTVSISSSISNLSSFSVKYILKLRFNFSLIFLINSSLLESQITSAGVILEIEFSISSSLRPESKGTAVVPVISSERYDTIHSYELRPNYYYFFI